MDYPQHSTDRRVKQQPSLSACKCILGTFTYYETPKMVRFEAKVIGFLSLIVKLSLAVGCSCLMFQRSSYQIFDRSPISAVLIKVKQSRSSFTNSSILHHFLNYTSEKSFYDVNDFILPATENSAVSITTRINETEHILRQCDNRTLANNAEHSSLYTSSLHQCDHPSRCILPPFYRNKQDDEGLFNKEELCWFTSPSKNARLNYEALDYIIFIKHFIEFPQLDFVRNNLESDILTKAYINTCEYDRHDSPLCPNFRILKILQMIEKNPREYESMLFYGSLIEIRISWKCNLDRSRSNCEPTYEFERLDVTPYTKNPFAPGSTFLTSRHFFLPNDHELHRLHTQIYNIHIVVSVTGEAGIFDLFQTTTSIGSFLGIFGTGSIVCDLIAAFITNFKRVKYDN